MSDETTFLDLADLMRVAERLFDRRPDVRDFGLLESALARPQATVFGEDAYPRIHGKAAALLSSLANNHGLVDGNERLAWTATRVFYGLNGMDLRTPEDDAYDLVIAIADGSLIDVEKIAETLRTWAR